MTSRVEYWGSRLFPLALLLLIIVAAWQWRGGAPITANLLELVPNGKPDALEQQAGRERPYVNAPRTLDLDLLMYGQATMNSPRLTLPHPRWRERAFVLYPLADLWPGIVTDEDRARVSDQSIGVLPEPPP